MNKERYIEQLVSQLSARVSKDQQSLIKSFTELFWLRTLDEDLLSRDLEESATITEDCWRRLVAHSGDQVSILLSNPSSQADNILASRTVVQVTAPNMPFMVDSVLMALSHDGLITHLLTNVVFAVERAQDGNITRLSADLGHANRELMVYAEIDRLDDEELPALQARLETMARELEAVVADYVPMKQIVEGILHDLKSSPPPLPEAEIEEGCAFLEWMLANHFTFLGYREFAYREGLIRQVGTALGMLRVRPEATARKIADQPQETKDFLMTPALLTFSKSGTKSQVHRPTYPDYVGVKRFDKDGNVVGEVGFLGLYTSRVYKEFPERIPHVRKKVARVIAKSGLDPNGFDGKVLAEILATYPRDELVQTSEADLFETAMAITDIHERRRVRVFPRYDSYGLFVTILVYMPRDLFNTQVRLNLHDLLVETFGAEDADYDAYLSESILVRLQYNLRIGHGSRPHVDRIELENRIASLIGDWVSDLNTALIERFGAKSGRTLKRTYHEAFPAGYREEFAIPVAVEDIATIEAMGTTTPLATRFYRVTEGSEQRLHLKIYHVGEPLPLSDVVPKLENMGLRIHGEHPYTISRVDQAEVSAHDFELEFDGDFDLNTVGDEFNTAFVRAWNGELEDDSYNRLILTAGLTWRQISILRAYAQYMKQIRFGFSQAFISDTLDEHRSITADLIRYFELKFDPEVETNVEDVQQLQSDLLTSFEGVSLLNEDRVLRRFLEIIDATKRTNYYRTDDANQHRSFLALKITPSEIANVPRPVPMFEIFISSADFEGAHLRGGPIARGGLRWSDRREDFRTEVLGLVKAQVVKNAVIVPTGAKGGFVLKGNRAGVECYRDFIRGLLDTTDNIIDGEVITPPQVKALDGEDPYLVVAADKGTATFSDEANKVADEYDFWLGDGFASGGSNGYDHKKMGITARGAWVSVQRHFAERDINVQSEPITVLGIGDMGGDVFGNGMLSSRALKLVAAFNHLHIFIDPDPDPEKSFVERERLFNLPRSSWEDYSTELISKGGGIFSRTAKSISLSAEMRELFAIEADKLAPDDLIHHLLRSPVQLIWNGGIGTYVKASSETHDEVGDRANDHLRVDACDLRCSVFGEGGNLGLTQRARIEFSLHGGAANTDFIDNSAGVDCSDHEVNIKIALNNALAAKLLDADQRNALLQSMTDDVAQLVLHNNYLQAQTLSLATRHASKRELEYRRTINYLALHADLDRELEYLPSDEMLMERFAAGKGLTRPEMAVLLAYAKSHIKNELISGDVHTDSLASQALLTAFPAILSQEYSASLTDHRLAKEIIATQIANEVVDHMGISFVPHLIEYVGGAVEDVVRAYLVVARCYDLKTWFNEIRDLDGIAEELRLALLLELMRLGRRATRWVLRHKVGRAASDKSIEEIVAEFKPTLSELIAGREQIGGGQGISWRDRVAALRNAGLSESLAQRSANAADLSRLLSTIEVARGSDCSPAALAAAEVRIDEALSLDWLAAELSSMDTQSHWQAMERDALLDEITTQRSRLGARVLIEGQGEFHKWQAAHDNLTTSWQQIIDEARHTTAGDFSMYAMLTRKLGDLLIS